MMNRSEEEQKELARVFTLRAIELADREVSKHSVHEQSRASALQSIEKEIEKKQNQERNTKLFTHIHTTASTA